MRCWCLNVPQWSAFPFRHHCYLPLGGLQSPGAARAGPVRHHLSLPAPPCHPLRVPGGASQTICLRLHLQHLHGTAQKKQWWTATNIKIEKWEKIVTKKKKPSLFCVFGLFFCLQHHCSHLGSVDFCLIMSLSRPDQNLSSPALFSFALHPFFFFYTPEGKQETYASKAASQWVKKQTREVGGSPLHALRHLFSQRRGFLHPRRAS